MRLGPAALAALTFAVAGCAGAPTRIHTLDAVSPSAPPASAYSGMAFRVDAVHVPPALDRPELIRRTEPYTLTLSDTDRWAAPLGELMRRALTQDLARRLPEGTVIFPDAPKPAAAGGLVVDVLSITPTDQGVDMEVSWTWVVPRLVQQPQPTPPIAAKPLTAHLSAPSSGAGPAAIAPEISALLGLLADRIATGR